MPPIKYDDTFDMMPSGTETCDETSYISPDGTSFTTTPLQIAGINCLEGNVVGCGFKPGALIVLDGTRILRRVGRLVERGAIDPSALPRMIGIDPKDSMSDYTPWPSPPFREGAPEFEGKSQTFLDGTVLPVAYEIRDASDTQRSGSSASPIGLFGYSLAGLFCLETLTKPEAKDVFDRLLAASPSVWYPGFVDQMADTPFFSDPRVSIAFGADEGVDHPEPIRSVRKEADRLIAILTEKLSDPPHVAVDDKDHHGGLAGRLKALLETWQ